MQNKSYSSSLAQKISEIVEFIQTKITYQPQIGVILGSGLGEFVNVIKDKIIISYAEIPHLPPATAPSHAGNLIFGRIADKNVMVMQGRLHGYEGNTPQTNVLLVWAMKKLGVSSVVISCAAGGLNHKFNPGDIMVIDDQINLTGNTPLTGPNLDEFGLRFPIMFDIYDKSLACLAHEIASKHKVYLQRGVYVGVSGPQYSTRAELKYFIDIGGGAIGMSVVHEAIAAAHSGLRILGLAAITDLSLPYAVSHITEQEVIDNAQLIEIKFRDIVTDLIAEI